MDQANTLPKLLKRNYESWGAKKIALRDKQSGIWQEYSWKDYYEQVKKLALGLKTLGFQPGEKICILGDNEPEWYWAELACQALRGAAIGIFADSTPEEVKHIVNHADAVLVVARDQEQIDKILQIRKEIPKVKNAIYWVSMGMENYQDPWAISFQQVQKQGEEYAKKNPGSFEEEMRRGQEEDLAILSYTSGATDSPQGCMVTHKNLIFPVKHMAEIAGWNEGDNYLSYFPPAWILEQFLGLTTGLVCGAAIHFPEGPETLQSDFREIGPSIVLYHFRMWESLYSTVQSKMKGGSPVKKALFNACLSAGYKAMDQRLAGTPSSILGRFLLGMAHLLVFRPLKDKIGLLYARSAYSGGASLSPGAFRFFQAAGIPLKQLYASSEAGICCCPSPGNKVKNNCLGLPLPRVEIKISDEGELLLRGDGLFTGYYKNPEKTAQVLADGWYHSGDAARTAEEGHLIYLDRMADMLELDGKEKIPAQTVEITLRISPYIKEGIVPLSGRSPYVVALIQIDFQAVGQWAEVQRIAYTTFADLSQRPPVYDLVEKEIKILNLNLPERARVRKFVCLPKELNPEDGELTRDGKLRKNFLKEKYRDLLEAIYSGEEAFLLKGETKSGTGSGGGTNTSVTIRTLV